MKWLQLFVLVLFTHLMEAQWIMHTTKTSSRQTTVPTTIRQTTVPTTTTPTNTTVKYTTVHQATKTTTRPSTTRKATTKEVTTTPPTTVPRTTTRKTSTTTTTPMITHDWFTSTTRRTTIPRTTTPKTPTTTTTPMITHDWFHTPTTVPHTTTPKTTTPTPKITHDWFTTRHTTPKITTTSKVIATTVPWFDWDSLICQRLPDNYNSDHAKDRDNIFSVRANSTCVRADQVLKAKLTMAGDDEERYFYILQVHKINEAMAFGKFLHPTETTVISCGQPHSNNTYLGQVHSESTDSPIWKASNNLMEHIIFNATVVDTWSGEYWINVTSQVVAYDPFCNIDVIPPVASARALESISISCLVFVGCLFALSMMFTVA